MSQSGIEEFLAFFFQTHVKKLTIENEIFIMINAVKMLTKKLCEIFKNIHKSACANPFHMVLYLSVKGNHFPKTSNSLYLSHLLTLVMK